MKLTQFSEDMDIISRLSDTPELSASDLKATFDKGGNLLKNYLNNILIPSIDTSLEENSQLVLSAVESIPKTMDSLDSQSTKDALSANMGRQLNELINQNTQSILKNTQNISTINNLLDTKQSKITYGTGEPMGGADGDIYIKY